jgi:hypothetical protein
LQLYGGTNDPQTFATASFRTVLQRGRISVTPCRDTTNDRKRQTAQQTPLLAARYGRVTLIRWMWVLISGRMLSGFDLGPAERSDAK